MLDAIHTNGWCVPQYMFELLNNKLETNPRKKIARLTLKNVIDDLGMLKEDEGCCIAQVADFCKTRFVESKTRKHHGRVGSGGARRGGWAGRARQGESPTGLIAQDTTVPRALQGIEDNCPEHLLGSTNKGNPM